MLSQAKLVLPFLSLLFALPSFPAPRSKKQLQEPTIELKVSGPHFIHQGQKLAFKVQLRNRSSTPILIAARDAAFYFQMTWTISDSSGRELRRVPMIICPVGGFGWNGPETLHMKDSDLTVLPPGDKLEFAYDDISDSYLFPGSGRYQVTFAYTFVPPPPERDGPGPLGGLGGVPVTYDLHALSQEMFESLGRASTLAAVSDPFLLILN